MSARRPAALRMQFDDLAQQREAAAAGMWVFLATEVLFFGGVLFVYAVYRASHLEAFVQASDHLDLVLGSVNTALLLASSFAVAVAVHAAGRERRALVRGMLALTLVLGCAFLAIKAHEWHAEHERHLVPFLPGFEYPGADPAGARLFFNLYFVLTGLHFLHLAIGVVLVAVQLGLVSRTVERARLAARVEVTGLYWHYVDVVWVFLFPLLYLIR